MNKKPIRIDFSHKFNKHLRKAPTKIKLAFRNGLILFGQNPFNPLLNNHSLSGELSSYRSINVTGDWRAIYSANHEGEIEIVVFEMLGTHSQLYKS